MVTKKNKIILSIVLNNFKNDSRVLKQALSLSEIGFNVVVVALHDANLPMFEKVNDFTVSRIKLITRLLPKWKLIQLIKFFEFMWRCILAYRNRIDYLHCHDLDAFLVGYGIKMFSSKKMKIVYDAHEHETETHGLQGMEKWLKKQLEAFLISSADEVITVSNSIALEYELIYKIKKPHLILNCPFYSKVEKKNIFRDTFEIRSDQRIFLYQGALGRGRGIEFLLSTFINIDRDDVVLILMGYGELEEMIKNNINSKIFFHPAVDYDVLLDYTSSADFGIAFIEDSCLSYRYCLPNKIFEYFMAGLPVLTSNLYEMKRIVEVEGVGASAIDNTTHGFRDSVLSLLTKDYAMMQNNVFKIQKKYSWQSQEGVLVDIYDKYESK